MHNNIPRPTCQGRDDLVALARKRRANDHIIDWMRKWLSAESLAAMQHCGDYLVMLEDATRTQRKLDVGYFCGQRLCSGCAWRAAVKSAQCVAAISGALQDEGRVMLMVTLTVPNVPADELRATIQHINASWTRLTKRQRYKPWADSIRKIEVTYNARTDTYHPHLHAIAYVTPGYFRGQSYIARDKLLSDWREVTRNPAITQVDIRRCRDMGNSSAILEVAKYSAKASDYAQSERVLDAMYQALYHTHTMTYAGRCKQLRRDYLVGKLERYEQIDTTKYTMRVVYVWHRLHGSYAEHDMQPYDMDAAELERLRRDEERAVAYAMERAKRATELEWLYKTDWMRADWDAAEVWDDRLPTPLTGEQVSL